MMAERNATENNKFTVVELESVEQYEQLVSFYKVVYNRVVWMFSMFVILCFNPLMTIGNKI